MTYKVAKSVVRRPLSDSKWQTCWQVQDTLSFWEAAPVMGALSSLTPSLSQPWPGLSCGDKEGVTRRVRSDQTNIVTRLCCGQTQPGFLLKIDATVLPWEKIVDRGRHKLLWLDICMKSKTFAKQFVSSDASLWNNASSTPSDDHPPKWNYRFQVVCHDHISRHITPRITDRFSNFRPKERFSKVILKYRDWAAA